MAKSKKEIRIRGVSEKMHEELHNIADNIGVPFPLFIKPELRKICESYPDKMKKPYKKDE